MVLSTHRQRLNLVDATPTAVIVVIQLLTCHKTGLKAYILCQGMPLLWHTSSPHDVDTLCVSNAGGGHSLSDWNDRFPLLQLNTYSALR
jgi:hypothetical protein